MRTFRCALLSIIAPFLIPLCYLVVGVYEASDFIVRKCLDFLLWVTGLYVAEQNRLKEEYYDDL